MPVGLHVRPLQVARPEGDLTCVAGERMGRLDVSLGRDLRRHFCRYWSTCRRGCTVRRRERSRNNRRLGGVECGIR